MIDAVFHTFQSLYLCVSVSFSFYLTYVTGTVSEVITVLVASAEHIMQMR